MDRPSNSTPVQAPFVSILQTIPSSFQTVVGIILGLILVMGLYLHKQVCQNLWQKAHNRPINRLLLIGYVLNVPSMITLSFQVFLLLVQVSPMTFLPPGFTRFFLVLEIITRFNMGFEKIAGSSVAIYRSSYILCHKTVKYRIGEERLLVVLFLLAISVGLGFGIVTTMVDVYGNDYHGMLFYHLFVQRPMIGLQGPKRVWLPIRIFGALAVICNAGEFVSYLWIYLFQLHRENALISTANGRTIIQRRRRKNAIQASGQLACLLIRVSSTFCAILSFSMLRKVTPTNIMLVQLFLWPAVNFGLIPLIQVACSAEMRKNILRIS